MLRLGVTGWRRVQGLVVKDGDGVSFYLDGAQERSTERWNARLGGIEGWRAGEIQGVEGKVIGMTVGSWIVAVVGHFGDRASTLG